MTHPTVGGITVIIIFKTFCWNSVFRGLKVQDPTCLSLSFPGLPLSSGNRLGKWKPLVQLKRLGFLLTSLSSLGQTYNSKVIKSCLCYRYPPLFELPPSSYCFSPKKRKFKSQVLCATCTGPLHYSKISISHFQPNSSGAARVGYMMLRT